MQITNSEYLQAMADLTESFPGLKNRAKLERIYFFMGDLPLAAVKMIIQNIGDTAKSTPTPNDFKEAIKTWKTAYFNSQGHYYGYEKNHEEEKICGNCAGSGITQLTAHGSAEISNLMRCTCEWGAKNNARIPMFDRGLKQGFMLSAPALENFKPNENVSMWDKAQEWNKKIYASEDKWAALGYRHD